MLDRFRDPETARRLDAETMEMLFIRGGAEKILFVDPRPELNGRPLAEVATAWNLSVPQPVRRILTEANAGVMNLELYDIENTRHLARQSWMMTCTDGRTPSPRQNVTHPRVFGAFTRKLRQFVLDEGAITMPFAIRSMTGLAADFLQLPTRTCARAHSPISPFSTMIGYATAPPTKTLANIPKARCTFWSMANSRYGTASQWVRWLDVRSEDLPGRPDVDISHQLTKDRQ